MNSVVRKKWPRIRCLKINEEIFYRVDARRQGTAGKQETFKLLKDAEKRASEIEKQVGTDGTEALSFPVELRGMALTETSKIKETRNVHIEATLMAWLEEYKPTKLTGFVTPQTNFKKRTLTLHTDAGYRGNGLNGDRPEWPQDVLRHSYGSYWLAKFKNRAQLAESMGNSIQIIKKHYKRVVSKSDCAEYWSIEPGYEGQGTMNKAELSPAEIKARRAEKLRKTLD